MNNHLCFICNQALKEGDFTKQIEVFIPTVYGQVSFINLVHTMCELKKVLLDLESANVNFKVEDEFAIIDLLNQAMLNISKRHEIGREQ